LFIHQKIELNFQTNKNQPTDKKFSLTFSFLTQKLSHSTPLHCLSDRVISDPLKIVRLIKLDRSGRLQKKKDQTKPQKN
jgi:hypothetical protein